MGYMNEEQIVPTYQIVGSMDIPFLAYGNDTIRYEGKIFDLFHEDICKTISEIPKIIPGKTAFFVRFVNSKSKNKTIREIVALIDSVSEYTIDTQNNTCVIQFKFTEVPVNTFDPGLQEIKPIISHILSDKDYIALIFEGDIDFITSYTTKNMRTFSHGGKVYWLIDTLFYSMHLKPGDPSIDTSKTALAVVVVASTLKVADVTRYKEFQTMLGTYMNNIYGGK